MKKRTLLITLLWVVLSLATVSFALEAPKINVSTNGTTLSTTWSSIPGATGYTLLYAPYPYTGPETIQSLDLGNVEKASYNLWDGAAYYLAVKSYNNQEMSDYSNIESFIMQSVNVSDGLQLEYGEGEWVLTQPMLYEDRLYVLTEKAVTDTIEFNFGGETMSAPIYKKHRVLYCYDAKSGFNLRWKTQVTDNAPSNGDFQKNLLAIADQIMVVTTYKTGENLSDEKRQISYYDPVTGDLNHSASNVSDWTYKNPKGELEVRSTGNESSTGMIVEDDGEFLFAQSGFGVSACENALVHTGLRGYWKLTTSDPIRLGSRLFMFLGTGRSEYVAVSIDSATAALKGFGGQGTLYTIPFGQNGCYNVTQPVIHDNKFYFAYTKEDNQLYLGTYKVSTGALINENILLQDGENFPRTWSNQPVLSGSKLVIPGGSEYLIYDINDATLTARVAVDEGISGQPFAVSGDNLIYIDAECTSNCESIYTRTEKMFVVVVSLETGTRINKIYSDALPAPDETYGTGEALLHNGHFIFQVNLDGNLNTPIIVVVPTGDLSGNKLQYQYNNQGNSVVNIATTPSPDVNEQDEEDDGDSMGLRDFTLQVDLSEDTAATEELVYPDLFNLSALYSAYVPLLQKVQFSSDGEPSRVGEGALVVRGTMSCPEGGSCCPEKMAKKLFYPYHTYLPLDEKKVTIDGAIQQPYLTYYPNIPLYYTLWESVETDQSRKLHLSYNAYEHDSEDLVDFVVDNFLDVVELGVSIATADVCGMITSTLSLGEAAVTDEDEGFGSPFVYVTYGSQGTGSIFGIPQNDDEAVVPLSASDSPNDMQAVVGTASDVADMVCGVMDVTSGSINTDIVTTDIGPSPSGRYTKGEISLNKKLLLPVKSLKVTLDTIDSNYPWPIGALALRVGILGEDVADGPLPYVVDHTKTPYCSYVRHDLLSLTTPYEGDLELTLYDTTFDVKRGLAGAYVEVGLQGLDEVMELPIPRSVGVFSDTKFFQDILYGAWTQDSAETRTFSKRIKRKVRSSFGEAYIYLTYTVELDYN